MSKVVEIDEENMDTITITSIFGSSDSDDESSSGNAFTTTKYTRQSKNLVPDEIELNLRSSRHSLWGHLLWNASIHMAEMIDCDQIDVKDRVVLELGAGAGLPSLISGLNRARNVVITDYGTEMDKSLINAIYLNVNNINCYIPEGCIHVAPYIWGDSVAPILNLIGPPKKFDVILLADLIFNRSEHQKLLKSCYEMLELEGTIWVTWSHHDPPKTNLDLNFFKLATAEISEGGFAFKLKKYPSKKYVDLFQENDGMDDERGIVYMCTLTK